MSPATAEWPIIEIDGRFDLVVLRQRVCRVAPIDRGEVREAVAAGSVLRGPEQLALELAEYWYPDPEGPGEMAGFVQVVQQLDGPERTRILAGRRSIGIYRRGETYSLELNIAGWRTDQPDRLEGYRTATKENLEAHLDGVSLASLFSERADAIGTRSDVLGDTGRRRHHLAATFVSIDARVPTIALIVGAVIPTWALHGTDQDEICV